LSFGRKWTATDLSGTAGIRGSSWEASVLSNYMKWPADGR
jgi:hypothetical protein